jgi:hypothetical protein
MTEQTEKTNYDFIKFLVKDGGHYDCAGHLAVLQKAFPKSSITIKDIRSVRSQISTSKHVVCVSHIAKSRQKSIRVISVDPQYQMHTKPRTAQGAREKITDSYLKSEPESVVRCIILRQQFDALLSGCRGLSQR